MSTAEKCLELLNNMRQIKDSRFEEEYDLEYLSEDILKWLKTGNYKTQGGQISGDDFAILFPNDTLIMYDGKSCLMYFYDDLRVLIDSFHCDYLENSINETIEKYKKEFL